MVGMAMAVCHIEQLAQEGGVAVMQRLAHREVFFYGGQAIVRLAAAVLRPWVQRLTVALRLAKSVPLAGQTGCNWGKITA